MYLESFPWILWCLEWSPENAMQGRGGKKICVLRSRRSHFEQRKHGFSIGETWGVLVENLVQKSCKMLGNWKKTTQGIILEYICCFFWWKIKRSFLKKNVFFWKKGFPILAFAISFVQLGNDLPDVGIFIPCLFKGRSPHDQWRKSWLFIRLGQVLPWLPRLKKTYIYILFSTLSIWFLLLFHCKIRCRSLSKSLELVLVVSGRFFAKKNHQSLGLFSFVGLGHVSPDEILPQSCVIWGRKWPDS